MYKNKLQNCFSFTVEREKCPLALCECLSSVTVRQSRSFHILTSFAQVDADIREDIISLLLLGNDVASAEALVADSVTLKSCSIGEMFV